MDIKKLPIEQQRLWLEQRGWQRHPEHAHVWIDPDTRINYHFSIALDRAVADCRIESDTVLKPVVPPRKDDAPPITGSGGPIRR